MPVSPATEPSHATPPGTHPGGTAASTTTVLIVDDDPDARHIIGTHLARDGYRLLYASSGTEGLEMARAEHPDVITLDIMMPHVDGWSVLTALKREPDLARIPVVLVSMVDRPQPGFRARRRCRGCRSRSTATCCWNAFAASAPCLRRVVLVVEDDPVARELVERTIERLGHRPATAINGRDAVAWLEANSPPALILLDLLMPEMDGFAFLERICVSTPSGATFRWW